MKTVVNAKNNAVSLCSNDKFGTSFEVPFFAYFYAFRYYFYYYFRSMCRKTEIAVNMI